MQEPPELARLALAESKAQYKLIVEGVNKPPVPIKELISDIATVIRFSSHEFAGFCLEYDKIWRVYINQAIDDDFIGFVLAHELGHLILNHLPFDQRKLTPHQTLQIRCEADHYAYCLLMPEPWVRALADPNLVTKHFLAIYAKIFAVPEFIMARRLEQLKIPCDYPIKHWRLSGHFITPAPIFEPLDYYFDLK